jgi:hypothetical protein
MFRIFNSESGDWKSFPSYEVKDGKLIVNATVQLNISDLSSDKTMITVIKTPSEKESDIFLKMLTDQDIKEDERKNWHPVFTIFSKQPKPEAELKIDEFVIGADLYKIEDVTIDAAITKGALPLNNIKQEALPVIDYVQSNSQFANGVPPSVVGNDINSDDGYNSDDDINSDDGYNSDNYSLLGDDEEFMPKVNIFKIGDNVLISNSANNQKTKATVIGVPYEKNINYNVQYADKTKSTGYASEKEMSKPILKPIDSATKLNEGDTVFIGNSANTDKVKASIVGYNTGNKSYIVKSTNGRDDYVMPNFIFIENPIEVINNTSIAATDIITTAPSTTSTNSPPGVSHIAPDNKILGSQLEAYVANDQYEQINEPIVYGGDGIRYYKRNVNGNYDVQPEKIESVKAKKYNFFGSKFEATLNNGKTIGCDGLYIRKNPDITLSDDTLKINDLNISLKVGDCISFQNKYFERSNNTFREKNETIIAKILSFERKDSSMKISLERKDDYYKDKYEFDLFNSKMNSKGETFHWQTIKKFEDEFMNKLKAKLIKDHEIKFYETKKKNETETTSKINVKGIKIKDFSLIQNFFETHKILNKTYDVLDFGTSYKTNNNQLIVLSYNNELVLEDSKYLYERFKITGLYDSDSDSGIINIINSGIGTDGIKMPYYKGGSNDSISIQIGLRIHISENTNVNLLSLADINDQYEQINEPIVYGGDGIRYYKRNVNGKYDIQSEKIKSVEAKKIKIIGSKFKAKLNNGNTIDCDDLYLRQSPEITLSNDGTLTIVDLNITLKVGDCIKFKRRIQDATIEHDKYSHYKLEIATGRIDVISNKDKLYAREPNNGFDINDTNNGIYYETWKNDNWDNNKYNLKHYRKIPLNRALGQNSENWKTITKCSEQEKVEKNETDKKTKENYKKTVVNLPITTDQNLPITTDNYEQIDPHEDSTDSPIVYGGDQGIRYYKKDANGNYDLQSKRIKSANIKNSEATLTDGTKINTNDLYLRKSPEILLSDDGILTIIDLNITLKIGDCIKFQRRVQVKIEDENFQYQYQLEIATGRIDVISNEENFYTREANNGYDINETNNGIYYETWKNDNWDNNYYKTGNYRKIPLNYAFGRNYENWKTITKCSEEEAKEKTESEAVIIKKKYKFAFNSLTHGNTTLFDDFIEQNKQTIFYILNDNNIGKFLSKKIIKNDILPRYEYEFEKGKYIWQQLSDGKLILSDESFNSATNVTSSSLTIDNSLIKALNNAFKTETQPIDDDSQINNSLIKNLNNAFKNETQPIDDDSQINNSLIKNLNNAFKNETQPFDTLEPKQNPIEILNHLNEALESTKQGGKRDPDRERVYKLPIHKRKTDNYYNYE